MDYQLSENFAGGVWFTQFTNVNVKTDPLTCVNLVVPLAGVDAIEGAVSYLSPVVPKGSGPIYTNIVTVGSGDEVKITTLKALRAYVEEITAGFSTEKAQREFDYYVNLITWVQTKYLHIKSKPTADTLRDFTREVWETISKNSPSVKVYVHYPDGDIPSNASILPGWSFCEFIQEELMIPEIPQG